MLVARRGLGIDELRLIEPAFQSAVRWALFAEQVAKPLDESRRAASHDPPDHLSGKARNEFMSNRKAIRADIARLEAAIYPQDDDDGE